MTASHFSLGTLGGRAGEGGKDGMVEDVKASGERLMRLLGFNQYGIWPEDDWKTNLIWEAIRRSFISQPVSVVNLPRSHFHLAPVGASR